MEKLPPALAKSGATKVADRLKSISGGRDLDVCTVSVDFIQTLMLTLKDFVSFAGIDNLSVKLESASKKFADRPVEFTEMDTRILKFEDNSFDTVSTFKQFRTFLI